MFLSPFNAFLISLNSGNVIGSMSDKTKIPIIHMPTDNKVPAFLIFVPITTIMARVGANTVHAMDKIKVQRFFGIFLYIIGTIFIYRFLNL